MSTADKIIKIKELLDSGALTQEQYNLLKREIMAEVASKTQVIDTPSDTENTAQVLPVEAVPIAADSLKVLKPVDPSESNSFEVNRTGKEYRTYPYIILFILVVFIAVAVIATAIYTNGYGLYGN